MPTRRTILTLGAAMTAAMVVPPAYRRGLAASGSSSKSGRLFGYVPFTQPLFIPEILTPLTDRNQNRLYPAPGAYPRPTPANPHKVGSGPSMPRGKFGDVAHGIAPEFEFGFQPEWNDTNPPTGISGPRNTHEQEYGLITEETTQRFIPGGPDTPVFTYRDATKQPYTGRTPGPTILADYLKPIVLRNYNALTKNRGPVNTTHHDVETSIHLHGSHATAHGDGYPDFYVLAGEARDYYYPNIAPKRSDSSPRPRYAPVKGGLFDESWITTTMWYHDHVMDLTGFNVARGLAGFCPVIDPRQLALESQGVIPPHRDKDNLGGPLDVGLAFQDQRFNADGTLFYDFLDHDGRLGDVFTVNGTVQPFHRVERRKYRFRMLNASNARIYELRLSTRQKMAIIGADAWLLPHAVEVESFQLAQGQRHDVIIDFRDAPNEVYLENILFQDDGRGAKEIDTSKRTPLLKFVVSGGNHSWESRVVEGTVIRGFEGVTYPDGHKGQFAFHTNDEIVGTRRFAFDRSNGGWTINNRFFNPRRADAVPELGYGAEKWIFANPSGGWWHPIHPHLAGFQIKTVNGRLPRRERQFNSDIVALEGNFTAEILMKLRTFTGPYVLHCHALEHEDMRMMAVIDPTPGANGVPGDALDAAGPLDAETQVNPIVSGVLPTCTQLEAEHRLYFEQVGDHEPLDGRGIGFPDCKFDRRGRGNRG